MSENCVFSPSRQFFDMFRTILRHFSDILPTFPFSGLSNDSPVTTLKTTFNMTTLIFSTGGCPSYPFYSFKRVPWYPVFRENPSREVGTKDHSSSNPAKGNPPDLKTKVDVSKVDVKGFPIFGRWDKNSNTLKTQKLHTSGVCLREDNNSRTKIGP